MLPSALAAGPAAGGRSALRTGTAAQVTAATEQELDLSPAEQGRLVEVLMTESERAEWQSLQEAGAREAFLERFWARRDPTDGTADNELRELFLQRARRATTLFGSEAVPGWATPRGRVLLVYGLPDEQERRATDEVPELRWSWSDAPGSLAVRFVADGSGGWAFGEGAEPDLDYESFADNAQERLRLPVARPEFEVEDDPEDSETEAEEAEEAVEPPPTSPEAAIWLSLVRDGVGRRELDLETRPYFFPAADGTFVLVGFELGDEGVTFERIEADEEEGDDEEDGEQEDGDEDGAEEDPPEGEAATGEAAEESTGEAPAETGQEETEDEDTGEQAEEEQAEPEPTGPGPARAELRVFGGIIGVREGRSSLVHEFNMPLTMERMEGDPQTATVLAAPEEAAPTASRGRQEEIERPEARSFGVTLNPGPYRLAWGVMDVSSGRAATYNQVIEVPDFNRSGLALSSVVLARPPHEEETETMSVADVYPGLRLGTSLLDVDLERVFARDELFEAVFIVSGWQEDPTSPGRPHLEVEYRVLVVEEDGSRVSIARFPVQELFFHAVGQEVPLAQIEQIEPGRSYELEITVRDLVADDVLTHNVPFSVAAATAGPEQERQ